MRVEDRRLQNEMIFRDANERIRRAQLGMQVNGETVPFICECLDIRCHTIVHMTADEYERVRGHERWFLIAPDHDASDGEVVEQFDRYWILGKTQ
jgi:hypothetical protein